MSPVHITQHSEEGKMAGLYSINTSALDNENCMVRSEVKGSICDKCYHIREMKRKPAMAKAFSRNSDLLSQRELEIHEIPIMPFTNMRVASGGDFINLQHLDNIMKIVELNPNTLFTIFTKEVRLCQAYFNRHGKLPNLIMVYSVFMRNRLRNPKLPKWFDKTFRCLDRDFIRDNGLWGLVNCHRQCYDCMACYDQNDTTSHITEVTS